jgi:predicted ArsR family transcriptional regulator
VSEFFQRLAKESASDMSSSVDDSTESRLTRAAEILSDQGYLARWEKENDKYVLHVFNCPYQGLPEEHEELCRMDMELVSKLLNQTPRRIAHVIGGDHSCSYVVE